MVKALSKQHYIIPIFVPDLGCPHQCVFCNQKKITGQEKAPNQEEVRQKISEYLETIPKHAGITTEVAFYGGSFTAVDKELQKELLTPAYQYLSSGEIDSIRISTRPDAITEDIMSLLSSYGVDTVELGVQSMDDEVLAIAGRGHTSRDVLRATAMIKSWGLKLGFQIIVGLPGDNPQKEYESATELISLNPDIVRIYPCLVLKNTKLEKMYLRGEYTPLDFKEAVVRAANLLLMFEKANINVIRIGLQPSEQISLEGDVLAGPYHPSFREIVESLLALRVMQQMLKTLGVNRATSLTVAVSERDVSVVRGNRGINVQTLKEFYGINEFKTVTDSSLKRGSIKIISVDGQEMNKTMHRTELPE